MLLAAIEALPLTRGGLGIEWVCSIKYKRDDNLKEKHNEWFKYILLKVSEYFSQSIHANLFVKGDFFNSFQPLPYPS